MKKALLLSTLLFAGAANADFLGVTAEGGYYAPDANDSTIKQRSSGATINPDLKGKSGAYYGIALEHPIPLIPNFRFQGVNITSDAKVSGTTSKVKLDQKDYTLYYEFLDGLLWLNFDAGVSLRNVNFSSSDLGFDVSHNYPLGYASAYVALPGTNLSVGAELKKGGFNGSDITDITAKIKFQPLLMVGIEGGYRKMNMDLHDIGGYNIKTDYSGPFIGAFIHF